MKNESQIILYRTEDGKNPHCVINGENKFKRIFIKRKKK